MQRMVTRRQNADVIFRSIHAVFDWTRTGIIFGVFIVSYGPQAGVNKKLLCSNCVLNLAGS